MTLDEAIAKAKADGDVQLAEWLRQARGADAAARWYTEKLRDANQTIRKLLDENGKLREFATYMANALGIDREWCDTSWCDTDCMVEFGCQTACCGGETRCPAWVRMHELGIEAHVKEDE